MMGQSPNAAAQNAWQIYHDTTGGMPPFIAPDAYENRYQKGVQRVRSHYGTGDLIAGPAAEPAKQVPTAPSRVRDPQVAALQQDLNTLNAGLTVDGIMGPHTRAAMSKYGVVSLPPAGGLTARIPQARPAYTPPVSVAQQVPTARIPQARPNTGLLSALQSPYATSTGGVNAIQTARIPQPRPAYPLPVQQAALPAPPLMFHPVQMLRNAAAAAQREAQSRSSQGSRSGMGGGGGYVGGSYGGYGGGSITSGVGGAFRNR
jgi:peptidoglycan hydrolase-like protein with peptidoglycan-binding domain